MLSLEQKAGLVDVSETPNEARLEIMEKMMLSMMDTMQNLSRIVRQRSMIYKFSPLHSEPKESNMGIGGLFGTPSEPNPGTFVLGPTGWLDAHQPKPSDVADEVDDAGPNSLNQPGKN